MKTRNIEFINNKKKKLIVRLEPWAHIYEASFGESINIVSFSDNDIHNVQIILEEDGSITLYPETMEIILKVYKNGVELEPSFEQ